MTFFALLAAILIEHFYPLPQRRDTLLNRILRYLSNQLNAGRMQHGILAWFLVIIPLTTGSSLIYFFLAHLSLWLAWLWNIAVLYVCIRFKADSLIAGQIHQSLATGNLPAAQQLFARWRGISLSASDTNDLERLNIEAVLSSALQHLFGVIFWFALLSPAGPVGAVFYRTTEVLSKHWRIASDGVFASFSQRMSRLANNWPARLTALSFAIAGNFEDAVYCWRSQASHWPDANQGIVLASGAGALGVKLGMPVQQGSIERAELGLGNRADNSCFGSTLSLIWRSLTIWLFLLLLVALAQLAR
ncbi:MAG TPA: CobD/CbiB family protein [Burkholderiales bacterium]|nr:CobD/CbiB family protein [Burkholderiales bacterium]